MNYVINQIFFWFFRFVHWLKHLYVKTRMYFYVSKMFLVDGYLKSNILNRRMPSGIGVVNYCVHTLVFVSQYYI
jgi:hypothetical protein